MQPLSAFVQHVHHLALLQITEREFEELFPGQVARVGIVHDTTALDPLVKEYQKVTRQLEDLLDEYIGHKKQLKKIKRKKVRHTCKLLLLETSDGPKN
jgi:hypothetical protein